MKFPVLNIQNLDTERNVKKKKNVFSIKNDNTYQHFMNIISSICNN